MQIRINTKVHVFHGKYMSYEELLRTYFDVRERQEVKPEVKPTVQYSKGKDGKQGTLIPHESVEVVEGMVFTVVNTSNS